MLERHHATELMWRGCLLGKDNVKRGKGGGTLASGDRSSRRKEKDGGGGAREIGREAGAGAEKKRGEVGRALLKRNLVNVHSRCS